MLLEAGMENAGVKNAGVKNAVVKDAVMGSRASEAAAQDQTPSTEATDCSPPASRESGWNADHESLEEPGYGFGV